MPRSTSSGAPARPAGGLRVTILTEVMLAFGGGAHRIEAEQRAGRHDDARARLARPVDQVHVVDEHADRQRHEDAPALDGGLGHGGELRGGQAFDDDVGRLGQRGEADDGGAAT